MRAIACVVLILGLLKFCQEAPDLFKKLFSAGGDLLKGMSPTLGNALPSYMAKPAQQAVDRVRGAATGAAGGAWEGLVNGTGVRAGAKLGAAAGRKAGGNQFNAQRQGVYKTYGGKGTAGMFGGQKHHEVKTDAMKKNAEATMKQQFLNSAAGVSMYNRQLGEQIRAVDLQNATNARNVAQTNLENASNNAATMQTNVDNANNALVASQTNLASLQGQRTSINNELTAARAGVASSQAAVDSANAALTAAESSYSDSQRKMLDGLYAEEVKKLNGGKLDGITNEMRETAKANIMQRMANNIQAGNASVEERGVYNAMQQVEQLKAARDKAVSEHAANERSFNDISSQLSRLDSQIATAQNDVNTNQSLLDNAQRDLTTAIAERDLAQAEFDSREADIDRISNATYNVDETDTRLTSDMKKAAKNAMDDMIASTSVKNLSSEYGVSEDDAKLLSAYKTKAEEESMSRFKNSDEFRRQAAIQQEALTRINKAGGGNSGGGSSSGSSGSGSSGGGSK